MPLRSWRVRVDWLSVVIGIRQEAQVHIGCMDVRQRDQKPETWTDVDRIFRPLIFRIGRMHACLSRQLFMCPEGAIFR
jgi:hypothetical protein